MRNVWRGVGLAAVLLCGSGCGEQREHPRPTAADRLAVIATDAVDQAEQGERAARNEEERRRQREREIRFAALQREPGFVGQTVGSTPLGATGQGPGESGQQGGSFFRPLGEPDPFAPRPLVATPTERVRPIGPIATPKPRPRPRPKPRPINHWQGGGCGLTRIGNWR